MEIKKRKPPTISPDRIDTTPPDISIGNTKEEKKAKAFIKGREPMVVFPFRIAQSNYDQLEILKFMYKKSINHYLTRALNEFLEKDEIKKEIKTFHKPVKN